MQINPLLLFIQIILILCFNQSVKASQLPVNNSLPHFNNVDIINSPQFRIIDQQQEKNSLKLEESFVNNFKKNKVINDIKFENIGINNFNILKDFDKILKVQNKHFKNCWFLKRIDFNFNKKIAKINFNSLSQDQFLYKCIDKELIINIIKHYQQYLYDEGYITSFVSLESNNIKKGILKIRVDYGLIAKIIINSDNFFDKMQIFSAFANQQNKVLNINDLKQGLNQINRLSKNDAKLKIKASSINLYSDIIIENKSKFPLSFRMGYDNLGNNFSGNYRSIFDINIENILSLNDLITLNYTTNLNDPNNQKNLNSLSGSINLPLAYQNFSYDYSLTKFHNASRGQVIEINIGGFFKRQAFGYNRLIINKASHRLNIFNSLVLKESASYINRQKILTSTRRLSILNLGLNLDINFNKNVQLIFKPTWYKGLKILNAQKDQRNLDQKYPHAQFDYYKIYLSLTKKFIDNNNRNIFVFNSEIDFQNTNQVLYGAEQIVIGGYYSVRGFKDQSIVGDKGYFWRNKINLNLKNIDKLLLNYDIDNYMNYFKKFSIEPFFDYGYIKNNNWINKSDGRLSGGGFKLIFNSKNFNCSLTNSYALNHSSLLNSKTKNLKSLNFELSANF